MTDEALIRVFPSRRLVNVLDLQSEDIDIRDIARSLSRQCRYNGHLEGFISVAEHSLDVLNIVSMDPEADGPDREMLRRQAFLHDAAEAYIGDMTVGLKHTPAMAFFREVEASVEAAIFRKYHLPTEIHPIVKRADVEAGERERDNDRHRHIGAVNPPYAIRLRPFDRCPPIPDVETAFLRVAQMLGL